MASPTTTTRPATTTATNFQWFAVLTGIFAGATATRVVPGATVLPAGTALTTWLAEGDGTALIVWLAEGEGTAFTIGLAETEGGALTGWLAFGPLCTAGLEDVLATVRLGSDLAASKAATSSFPLW